MVKRTRNERVKVAEENVDERDRGWWGEILGKGNEVIALLVTIMTQSTYK